MARRKIPAIYKKAIEEIKKELNIDASVYWKKTRKGIGGSAYRWTNEVHISSDYIYLTGEFYYKEALRTLAHELRHIWQYTCGIFPNNHTWDGVDYKRVEIKRGKVPVGYMDQPWEKDAEEYAEDFITRFIRDNPYKTPERKRYVFNGTMDSSEYVRFSNGNINYRQTVLKAIKTGKKIVPDTWQERQKIERALAQLKTQEVI